MGKPKTQFEINAARNELLNEKMKTVQDITDRYLNNQMKKETDGKAGSK